MPCYCCEITDRTFGEEDARNDMREYRRRGPAAHTRAILRAVRSTGLKDATLLDIGGGIGAIHHELLDDIVREATHVDASSAFLKAAEEQAIRYGRAARVKFIHADFTDVAGDLSPADIVTLDRVVCCYPDFHSLLTAAAGRSERLLAMTYPRETWYLRLGVKIANFIQRLRRDPFRMFLHPVADMDSLLKKEGFQRLALKRLFVWEMALYRRGA